MNRTTFTRIHRKLFSGYKWSVIKLKYIQLVVNSQWVFERILHRPVKILLNHRNEVELLFTAGKKILKIGHSMKKKLLFYCKIFYIKWFHGKKFKPGNSIIILLINNQFNLFQIFMLIKFHNIIHLIQERYYL